MTTPDRRPGPYSPRTMWVLALSGIAISLMLVVFGLTGFSSRPVVPLVIGLVATAFFLLMIPLARRRGRM
ncbi:hypothetical protein [Micromonospora sp. URMC 103]|uniref:hypothetical protein n=1 Tax=Micromonospora sp. URMC 103 TaxID=3423406 RepID=UPI003F1BCC51